MSKKRPFISLVVKMACAVMLGLVLALGMYICCNWVQQTITAQKYQSEAAIEQNVGEAYENLEAFIKDYHVAATDTKALSNG